MLVKDKQNPAGASSSVGPVDPLRLSAGNETIASRPPRGSTGGVHERACTRRAAFTATGNQTIAPRLGCREEEEEERRRGGERGRREGTQAGVISWSATLYQELKHLY